MTTTKRGINLGCGNVTLPRERPQAHGLIPEELYTDPAIEWHNVDWNAGENVTHVVDLFDYPWRTEGMTSIELATTPANHRVVSMPVFGEELPDDHYDYAILSHIAEHIPHHIVEHGQFVHRHAQYQDGWFYFFAELNRILKPGGVAYILVPYAFTNGAMADPTHTRYLLPASFNYLVEDTGSPFEYRGRGGWQPINYDSDWGYRPHDNGMSQVMADLRLLAQLTNSLTRGTVAFDGDYGTQWPASEVEADMTRPIMWLWAQSNNNVIVEFCMKMTKVSDAGIDDTSAAGTVDAGSDAEREESAAATHGVVAQSA